MKFHANTDEQGVPLDLSKKSENTSSQEFENTIENGYYVYSKATNEDQEIIYVQHIYENENEGTDEPTAPGKVNTPDHSIQHEEGKRFSVWLYRGMVAEEVEKVPQDINGMKLYKIPASDDTWCDLTADCRYFVMQTSSRSTLFGT